MNQNPEQLARDKIDSELLRSGWLIQSKNKINLNAGIGIAVREYQTDIGPADYVLFVDRKPVVIIEAKRAELAEQNKHSLKAGPFGFALKKEFYVENGYKVYGQEQVINNNAFYGNYVDEKKYQELISCKIKPSDILISLIGTVGKVLLLPENCHEGVINPALSKFL